MSSQTITIFLMRHGEITSPNCLAGHTDFELSTRGLEQMSKAVSNIKVKQVLTSPLLRCSDFAKQYANEHDLTLTIEPVIKEMNFGIWDGKPFDALWQLPKPNIGDYWESPYEMTPPEGESLLDFEQRVGRWWQSFINEAQQDALVVCHAGVLKVLVARLLELPNLSPLLGKLKVNYASMLKVTLFREASGDTWPTLHL